MIKRNLTPIDLIFFKDDSDDELTEHRSGADGLLAQLINMKPEARNYVRIENDKADLSGRLWCEALLEIALTRC